MKVKDKICVVTGAAGGIGEAIARRYAKEGAKGVVVADRDAGRLEAVARDIKGIAVACDAEIAVIGIAVEDDLTSVQTACKQLNINYPVALGDKKLSAVFGGVGFPTTFVIGRDGRIYSKHPGATNLRVLEDEVAQLLETGDTAQLTNFRPAGKSEPVELPTPEELNSEVPGVDISQLNATQLADFKILLEKAQCDCGCRRALR